MELTRTGSPDPLWSLLVRRSVLRFPVVSCSKCRRSSARARSRSGRPVFAVDVSDRQLTIIREFDAAFRDLPSAMPGRLSFLVDVSLGSS